jgi:nucleoside-diphosphate-sugar epimerase
MRILIAGATGAIGRQLVPRLAARGHDVHAIVRDPAKSRAVEALGATPVIADALDADDVARAVAHAAPDAIVHELTALSGTLDMRHWDRSFAMTNRLRTEATDHLLAAGRAAGVRRFVAQSYAGWPYARTGGPVKDEEAPLDPRPVKAMRETLAAIRHLEDAVTAAGGIVLRYGALYGPGTSLSAGGEQVEMLRRRRWPVVGSGAGTWSFIHVGDAADATVAAVEHGAPGIYNVVDDEPAPVAEWLPAAAAAAGAPAPRRVPRWVGRILAGDVAAVMMTEVRGASNAKAKRELGWTPAHPSWRTGFQSLRADAAEGRERTAA